MSALSAALVTVAALLLRGCGGDAEGGAGNPSTAIIGLDFTPNAVHAPIYAAVRNGYDRKHEVRLRIRPPGSSPDSLKLLTSGRADAAVLDIHDLGLARERGGDVVGVAALVQRPLELRDDRGYWAHRSQLCTDELSVSTPSPCDLGNRRLGSDSTDSMPSLRA